MAEQQQQQEPSPQQAAGVQSSEEAPGDQEPKVRYSGVVKWFNATKGLVQQGLQGTGHSAQLLCFGWSH